ncbi:MAG: glycosyltransferase family 2 protein [Candidatus Limousia pullorum]
MRKDNYRISVSVIIPIYNVENYLTQCLDSIRKQTLKNIEIICVDDGSEDNSTKVIRQLQQSDDRIFLFQQENQGSGSARNVAMSKARGEFIAFMDADDWYPETDVLECLYTKAKENSVLICGGSFSSFNNGEIITEFPELNKGYVFEQEGLIKYEDYQFDFGYQRFIFNRSFLNEKAITFPDYRRFQDPPFFVRAMIEAQCFYAVPKIVYTYRVGHKEIEWTPQKAMDLLSGVTDLLYISDENNLEELHYRAYCRLCSYTDILFSASQKDPEFCMSYMYRANRAVNISILRKYNHCLQENNIFPALDIFLHYPLRESDTNQPKVSVIIPIYNAEEFIVECIGSVVNQTLREIEIICVDDGSTDNSTALLQEKFGKDPRIKIINKKNGGLSSARNAGVRVATGEYIYFLDSDDFIDISAFEILYKEAKKNSLDLLAFDADLFSGERFTAKEKETFKSKKVQNYYHRQGVYSEIAEGQVLFLRMKAKNEYRSAVGLQFIRREFYLRNKIDFYDGIIHEDNLFTLKTFLLAGRAKHIPFNFCHHRVRRGSVMTEKESAENLNGYFITYCEALRFLMGKCDAFYPEVRDAYVNEMNEYVQSVRRNAKSIPQQEREEFYVSLNHYEKIIFDFICANDQIEGLVDQLGVTAVSIENEINENIASSAGDVPKAGVKLQNTGEIKKPEEKKERQESKNRFLQKVCNFFCCLRQHGFKYTMIRLFCGRRKAIQYEVIKNQK